VLEVRKTKMLDQQLSHVNEALGTTRNLMGGINTAKEQSITVQKRIKLLENRLERAYVKFNQSITHNKQLREQINNLRRERIMFESIHSNLERELAKVKKDMAETIQLANQIFEAKEKAIAEMGQLMAQAEKEQAGFEEEWRQLTQIIEDDKRERERLRAKELAERERETQELLKSGMGMSGTGRRAGTATKRGTLGSPAANKALAQNVAAEKVQMYGQAFEKIQQATGIEEIDQLVNSFISAEGQNYTLFNYVNEVNNEIEKLEDQTQVIKVEIERYRDSGQELDRSKGSAMRDVEDRLAAAESQADLYEKRFEAASETVAMLKSSIWELFNKIGCNTQAVRELLGEEGQVSEGNVLAHLGIIEQRTNEILQAYLVHRSKDKSKAAAHWPSHNVIAQALLAQPLTSASPRIIIDPPNSTGPTPEEVEMLLAAEQAAMEGTGGTVDMASLGAGAGMLGPEDDKPLSREALITRVSKTMPRKLETAIKVRPAGASDHKRGSPVRR